MDALANAGKTNAHVQPGLLQSTLIGREFEDVIVFTSPARWVQRSRTRCSPRSRVFAACVGSTPSTSGPQGSATPDPAAVAAAGIEPPAAAAAA